MCIVTKVIRKDFAYYLCILFSLVKSWKRMKKQADELKRNENLSQMGFSLDFGRKEVSTVY